MFMKSQAFERRAGLEVEAISSTDVDAISWRQSGGRIRTVDVKLSGVVRR